MESQSNSEELLADPEIERDIDLMMLFDFDHSGYISMREFFEPTQEEQEELERRKAVLEFMISHNIRDYKEVANIIHAYQSKPEKVLEKMVKTGTKVNTTGLESGMYIYKITDGADIDFTGKLVIQN